MQYAENHGEKNLPEIDVNELRMIFGKSVPLNIKSKQSEI
jgi:hypothetical protein